VTAAVRTSLDATADFTSVLRLRFAVQDRVDAGCRHVEVDLSQVPALDPCAVGVLVRLHRQLASLGQALRVVGGPAPARRELADAGAHLTAAPGARSAATPAGALPATARIREAWTFEVTELLHTRHHLVPEDGRRAALRTAAIEASLPHAGRLARRYDGLGESPADLRQVAAVGLVKAVDGYDPGTGTDFWSYALPTVVGELKRCFRDHGWAVRVPRGMQETVLEVKHARAHLTQRLSRPPSVPEIAAFLRLDRDRVAQATLAANAYRSVSLYTPVGDAGLAPVDRLGESDAELDSIELRESIAPLLRQLSRRDKQIVAMRFYGNQSQAQIAAQLGISQMQVSRLLRRIVGRLRSGLLSDSEC